MRECEGGHCVPPILTPAKGYLEEKVNPGFGPSRKRPLSSKAEQDDTEREDGERMSHPEKRARISAGEDFLNMLRHPHVTSIFPQITRGGWGWGLSRERQGGEWGVEGAGALLSVHLSNSARSLPFILCSAEPRLIPCSL